MQPFSPQLSRTLLRAGAVRKLLQLAPLPACRGWCSAARSTGTALLPDTVAQPLSRLAEKRPIQKCPNSCPHTKGSISATTLLQTSPHGHSFCTITKLGVRCWHSWRAGLSTMQRDHPTNCCRLRTRPPSNETCCRGVHQRQAHCWLQGGHWAPPYRREKTSTLEVHFHLVD